MVVRHSYAFIFLLQLSKEWQKNFFEQFLQMYLYDASVEMLFMAYNFGRGNDARDCWRECGPTA